MVVFIPFNLPESLNKRFAQEDNTQFFKFFSDSFSKSLLFRTMKHHILWRGVHLKQRQDTLLVAKSSCQIFHPLIASQG